MNAQLNKKGFTIIEVVLVLAIAGLIFLMVFVALPALQSGQRDSARKNDVGSVASAVNTYTSNSRGRLPTKGDDLGKYSAADGKWSGYLNSVSASTTKVAVVKSDARPAANAPVTTVDGTITIYLAARCGATSGEQQAISAGTARQYAVVTRLESGGGVAFCQES